MRSRLRGVSRRLTLPALLSLVWMIALVPAAPAQELGLDVGVVETSSDAGPLKVLVELADPPAAVVYGEVLRSSPLASRPAVAEAVAAAQAQIRKIEAEQLRFESALASLPEKPQEIFRVSKALNGFALLVDPGSLRDLSRLPGIKRIHFLIDEYPTNSTSVPFLGTANLWSDTLGLGLNADGTGIRIGIIDTGIDYQHADFGGNGVLADYQANNRTVAPDVYFPTAKVVGGFDFAGDNYTGGVPAPDPDPMDCNGHGSHVAGTAAGVGVNADGTPYAGPYTTTAAYRDLRIGPGTAPRALLYALRVFGCGGGTNLTVQAINWAMDPNGDNDLSDHLDVINMSLGSAFGSVTNASAVASDNAAFAGVIVVTSAGNNGDTFFISGAPGSGNRVLATAATADNNVAGLLVRVNTPGGIAGFYNGGPALFGALPPFGGVTGNVVIGLDPADGAGPLTTDGCSPLTNAAAVANNIAVIDRGTCGFAIKVKTAQDAGAIGVIIANNVAGVLNMTGADPTIIIPAVSVSLADGNTLKANIATLNATLFPASDTVAGFSSRGPRRASSPVRLKPDIAAPGLNITSVQTGITCTGVAPSAGCQVANATGFIPNSQPLGLQGTSMASPHMAGIMALLRQLHPTWTVEELKALAMNYATHDVTTLTGGNGLRHNPSRIGAGRVDPSQSAVGQVIAFNADDVGLVSVSFDTEVVGLVTRVKTIRLVNHGSTDQTYDLAIDTILDAPGVSFSLPGGSSVLVPAGNAVEVDVQMDADASLMDHFRDPTLATTQVVAAPASLANLLIPRHWLTEESGYVTFSQSGNLKLRVPVYVAPRADSLMAAADTIVTGGAGSGSTTIALSGTDVCTGTLGAGPTCTGVFPNDEVSLVSPFELQVASPSNPVAAPPYADLQYAGVAADANMIWFGVSTWGDWSSPTDTSFNIYVDNNLDGTYDRIIFNTSSGTLARALFGQAGQSDLDTFITSVFTPPNLFSNVIAAATPNFVNRVSATAADTALHNNNVMFFGALPAQLGLATVNTPFRYRIETCPGFAPLCQSFNGFHFDEAVGPFTWNGGARGLDFSNGTNLFFDLNGASLPVAWNTANMTANGSLGALLLHHHNGAGRRAEVVVLEGTAAADLSISKSVAPTDPDVGDNVTFTVTVTNNGPAAAAGVVVDDFLPAGVTYVSDDGGGSYNAGTGLWTVGALANAASATLNIVATVETSDPIDNHATITAGSPLDPDPSDNSVTVSLQAPRTADLELSMSVSSPTVLVGASVTYTLNVTNHGDDPAYSLDVTEAFPAFPALNPTSFTASQGVYNPSTGLWNLASLGRDGSASLQITLAAPNMAGALTNDGAAASGEADLDTANNTASATTTVLSPSVVASTKTVTGSFVEGGAITYSVVLSNTSAYDQQNNPGDEFTDVLPSQLTLTGASATGGTALATIATNTVTWNGSVPAGGSVTVTINATINAGTALQTVTNQAAFNHDPDGNGVNEGAGVTDDPIVGGSTDATSFVVVSPGAVGTRTKTVTGNFLPGGTVTYTITISNPSGSAQLDNPGDEFTDELPAQLQLQSATATSGSAVPTVATNTVTWNGTIAPAGSVTITITALILDGTFGATITNQGTVFFDADGNGTNESSAFTDDPALPGADDPTSFGVIPAAAIPTVSEIGLFALMFLLAAASLLLLRKHS